MLCRGQHFRINTSESEIPNRKVRIENSELEAPHQKSRIEIFAIVLFDRLSEPFLTSRYSVTFDAVKPLASSMRGNRAVRGFRGKRSGRSKILGNVRKRRGDSGGTGRAIQSNRPCIQEGFPLGRAELGNNWKRSSPGSNRPPGHRPGEFPAFARCAASLV